MNFNLCILFGWGAFAGSALLSGIILYAGRLCTGRGTYYGGIGRAERQILIHARRAVHAFYGERAVIIPLF